MKIAIYGTPRSGKTTFINQCMEKLDMEFYNIKHIKPSSILFKIANHDLGVQYFYTSDENMEIIHEKYLKEINKQPNDIIFFDCHAAYYNDDWNLLSIVSRIDKEGYDKYLYMKTDPSIILKRINHSVNKKRIAGITEELISNWQKFEISEIERCLLGTGKEIDFIYNERDEKMKCIDLRKAILDSNDKKIIKGNKQDNG
jgi:adenylate kinase